MRIIDLNPDFFDTSIIAKALAEVATSALPWTDDISELVFESAYMGHSGDKTVSPIVDKLITPDLAPVDRYDRIKRLVSIAYSLYAENWVRLYATLSLTYSPIENYDMTETEEMSRESTTNDNDTVSNVEKLNGTANADTTSNIWGFNASESVPQTNDVGTTTTTENNVRDITTMKEGKVNETSSRTLKRSGNIGVTTSQQMLQSERDLWTWVFFDEVFRNLDSVLAIEVY